jgi:hypothetical protein
VYTGDAVVVLVARKRKKGKKRLPNAKKGTKASKAILRAAVHRNTF